MKSKMKTPISYYGGKQMMLKHILPLIPEHTLYCEPFFGGGAVYFTKEPSKVEIINDYNAQAVNFYIVLKENFEALKVKINSTLFSRDVYKRAYLIYHEPYLFDEVTRAWAFWVCTNQGFSNHIGSWVGSGALSKASLTNYNKKLNFSKELSDRMDLTQVENIDAVDLIVKVDNQDAFFYIDPPYVGTRQEHYRGYNQQHFDNLLEVLSSLKGKFLLSSFPNSTLYQFIEKQNWISQEITKTNSVSQAKQKKIEILTRNYDL